jgi:mono/diheme cytochrome c family protein
MMAMMTLRVLAFVTAAAVIGSIAIGAGAQETTPNAMALVQRACVGCHAIEIVTGKGRSAQDWSDLVDRMADRGVDASDAELAQIKAYLAKTYPPANR